MNFVLVGLIVFAGVLIQSMIGFGVALITMPLLFTLLDPVTATTLVALFVLPLELIIIWRYRDALVLRPLWRLIVGGIIGIPIGVMLLDYLDSTLILSILGILLILYSLYNLLKLRLPVLRHPAWGITFGFFSGFLTGAYNMSGPPLVIYGTCQQWESNAFKANLQTLGLISTLLVIITHLAAGHVTPIVLQNLAVALPMVLIGSASGFWLSRFVNERVFHRLVLILLMLIGVRLLLP